MKWKLLIGAVLLAALGWSGWWWAGASTQERAFADWLAARRAEGWQAEAAEIATAGFPNRFDTRFTELSLADPAQGWAWAAPFLDLLMLSYAPNKAILAFPPEQRLSFPGDHATLRSEGMRASARLIPGPGLELSRLSAQSGPFALEGDGGWTLGADSLALHLVEADEAAAPAHAYRAFAELTGLRPPRALAERLMDGLPATVEALKFDGRAAFDAPFDRRAIEDRQPRLEALSITALEARWGALFLRARGRLVTDPQGYAEGALDVTARNWREMLRGLRMAGAISADVASGVELALALLGGGEEVSAPLNFRGGRMFLGPLPIGDAPRLAPPR